MKYNPSSRSCSSIGGRFTCTHCSCWKYCEQLAARGQTRAIGSLLILRRNSQSKKRSTNVRRIPDTTFVTIILSIASSQKMEAASMPVKSDLHICQKYNLGLCTVYCTSLFSSRESCPTASAASEEPVLSSESGRHRLGWIPLRALV